MGWDGVGRAEDSDATWHSDSVPSQSATPGLSLAPPWPLRVAVSRGPGAGVVRSATRSGTEYRPVLTGRQPPPGRSCSLSLWKRGTGKGEVRERRTERQTDTHREKERERESVNRKCTYARARARTRLHTDTHAHTLTRTQAPSQHPFSCSLSQSLTPPLSLRLRL